MGVERARARFALGQIERIEQQRSERFNAYEGAKSGRRIGDWTATTADANTANGGSIAILRARARDLCRNNAFARRAISELVGSQIGTGILPRADTGNRDLNKKIDTAFKEWSKQADADGQLDFWGLQRLIVKSTFESGEVLIRFRPRRRSDGLRIPLQVQVLEPDFIDSSKTESTDGGYTLQGIVHDKIGRRTGYWLFGTHPGAPLAISRRGYSSQIVPAYDSSGLPNLLHVYLKDRPGEVRGASWFAPVITDFADYDSYEEAAWMRKRMEACIGLLITSPEGTSALLGATESQSDGSVIEELQPGMITKLRPGQLVETLDPKPSGDYKDYSMGKLQKIAAGMGPMFEQITGNHENVNFASYRAGNLSYWSNVVEPFRWLCFIPMAFEPIYRRVIDAMWLAGMIPEPNYGVRWTGSKMPSVDPAKDAEATKSRVRSGFQTWAEGVAEYGYDPEEQVEEIERWSEEFDRRNLVLDSDPRKTTGNGGPVTKPEGATNGTANAA